MNSESLHVALHKAVEQFGIDVLTEGRVINILLDYDAFSDVPASKTILREIVMEGYGQKIIDLGKQKRPFFASLLNSGDGTIRKPEGEEWKNKLKSYSETLTKRNGFQQPLVEYVIDCVVFALDWVELEPSIASFRGASSQPYSGPMPKQPSSSTTSGTNKSKQNAVSYQQITDTQFLFMNVVPKNAEVYIDGEQQYVSNGVMAVELSVGLHNYEVKAEDYETQTGRVDINGVSKTEMAVQLKLCQDMVNLSVVCLNKNTEILINGSVYGKGEWKGLVKVGTYDIECRRYRYYPYKQTITLQPNKDELIAVPKLEPICGNLKINVQPYGSKIIINDREQGTTPLLVKGIQIGERKVQVLTSEGTEYTKVVEVRENQVTDVEHKIPSLFLSDYRWIRIGDFFYDDGTYSHKLAEGKLCVGMVFSKETSKEEKEHGWVNGQIVALHNAVERIKDMSWGIPNSEILQCAVRMPIGFTRGRDTGYLVSHLDSVLNNPEFKAFNAAAQYSEKLPHGITSGWYLPCLTQWKTLYENTHDRWQEIWHFLGITGSRGCLDYATSTPYDRNTAWIYRMGMAEEHLDKAYQKQDVSSGWGNVRAVAAF